MLKITKCDNCVVYLQFALIATSRLKSSKVLKVRFAWIKVIPVPFFISDAIDCIKLFSMSVEIAICLLILYTEWPHSDKLKCRMDVN